MTDYSAFGADTPPANAASDDTAYTMGLEFKALSQAWLKSIGFWQPTGNSPSSATRKALLYKPTAPDAGDLVVAAVDLPATVSGWNYYEFGVDAPLLDIGSRYKACIFHPAGRYAATSSYFSSGAGANPIVNGPLHVYDADTATFGAQDTFLANAAPGYPFNSSNSANYWIDVVLTDQDPTVVPVANVSIADIARVNMLAALGYTADQAKAKTNIDLMREVVAAGGLSLITVTQATAAVHYWRYLKIVRDS